MKEQHLQLVLNFIETIRNNPAYPNIFLYPRDAIIVKNNITKLSEEIKNEEPFFSNELFCIKDYLFSNSFINSTAFGKLVEITNYLIYKQNNPQADIWFSIHPRILDSTKKLFLDGHYSNATETAFKEIIVRLKKIYAQIKPSEKVPDGDSVITHVFSPNNPLLKICDTSTQNGENTQRGTMFLFQGANAAFRNPQAHSNDEYVSKEEALQLLMFASLLMYKIDDAVVYSKIKELCEIKNFFLYLLIILGFQFCKRFFHIFIYFFFCHAVKWLVFTAPKVDYF